MRTVVPILVLLLVCLIVPTDDVVSNDKPYRVQNTTGIGDGGDDHPWGGEVKSDDSGLPSRDSRIRTTLWMPLIDFILNLSAIRTYVMSHQQRVEVVRIERQSWSANSRDSQDQHRGYSNAGSERVDR